MKVAILGVWHVHAPDYTNHALSLGEVVGFFERNDTLAEAFAARFGLPRFETVEDLLASDCEAVIVCSATKDHAADMIAAARAGKQLCGLLMLTNLGLSVCLTIEIGVFFGNGRPHRVAPTNHLEVN